MECVAFTFRLQEYKKELCTAWSMEEKSLPMYFYDFTILKKQRNRYE